jgi:hypothetical protein
MLQSKVRCHHTAFAEALERCTREQAVPLRVTAGDAAVLVSFRF